MTEHPKSQREAAGAEVPIVFVIDDDESMRRGLTNLFESVGLRVEAFGSAPELLHKKLPDVPSCVVLDLRLPGMSGLDFQDLLEKASIHIPIVFMIGHGDIPMSVKAMKAGAADFLTKPFRQQETLDAVTAAISSSPAWVVRQAALLFKGMSQHLRGPAAENVATRTGAATYVEWLFLQPVENPRPHSGRTALRKLREICLTSTRCAPRLGLFA